MLTPVVEIAGAPPFAAADRAGWVEALEDGAVLVFPDLAFPLQPEEELFVERPFASGRSKNVNIRGDDARPRGAAGSPDQQHALAALLRRYRAFCRDLIAAALPAYEGHLDFAGTSYRPFEAAAREASWRKDDQRLHVDAFPSNPVGERRILRVFTNVNPAGVPRVWRVGEDFSTMAERFLPRVPPYSAATARFLALVGATKARRSEYDHIMLHLHDGLKRDLAYQAACPQREIAFSPGRTWVTFSDLVMHSVQSGQYMLEQTIRLPVEAQADPAKSPQRILARHLGRPLH
ncbi:MAG TPA: Kdo hydroxylase family protein [Hyphomicrobiales bacterium]|nr:Kdo hydroxylase family protein [Hyphomicrobiales bacterium]